VKPYLGYDSRLHVGKVLRPTMLILSLYFKINIQDENGFHEFLFFPKKKQKCIKKPKIIFTIEN